MALSDSKVLANVDKLGARLVKARVRTLRAASALATAEAAERELIAELSMYHAHPAVIESVALGHRYTVGAAIEAAEAEANELLHPAEAVNDDDA